PCHAGDIAASGPVRALRTRRLPDVRPSGDPAPADPLKKKCNHENTKTRRRCLFRAFVLSRPGFFIEEKATTKTRRHEDFFFVFSCFRGQALVIAWPKRRPRNASKSFVTRSVITKSVTTSTTIPRFPTRSTTA